MVREVKKRVATNPVCLDDLRSNNLSKFIKKSTFYSSYQKIFPFQISDPWMASGLDNYSRQKRNFRKRSKNWISEIKSKNPWMQHSPSRSHYRNSKIHTNRFLQQYNKNFAGMQE